MSFMLWNKDSASFTALIASASCLASRRCSNIKTCAFASPFLSPVSLKTVSASLRLEMASVSLPCPCLTLEHMIRPLASLFGLLALRPSRSSSSAWARALSGRSLAKLTVIAAWTISLIRCWSPNSLANRSAIFCARMASSCFSSDCQRLTSRAHAESSPFLSWLSLESASALFTCLRASFIPSSVWMMALAMHS